MCGWVLLGLAVLFGVWLFIAPYVCDPKGYSIDGSG